MSYIESIFLFACITLMSVMGVYLLTGLTGLFSFGQAAFMAIGAYASGLAAKNYGMSFPVSVLIGMVCGAFVALIIGMITLKLRSDYFSLVTLGFGEAVAAILNHFVKITGGATGMTGIPKRTTPMLIIISAIVIVILVRNIKYTRFGRICIAVKNDDLTARSLGISSYFVKLKVLVLSATISAFSGALYAFLISYVDPSMFKWSKSAEWVIFLFFGGVNSLTGSIISTFVLTALPEALRFASEYKVIIYCVLVLLIINFRPKGLFGDKELSLGPVKKLFSRSK